MATEMIDKGFVTIKVSGKRGTAGIKRAKEYVRFLEINKDAPRKISKKMIAELADEITAASWKKFKKQHNLQLTIIVDASIIISALINLAGKEAAFIFVSAFILISRYCVLKIISH